MSDFDTGGLALVEHQTNNNPLETDMADFDVGGLALESPRLKISLGKLIELFWACSGEPPKLKEARETESHDFQVGGLALESPRLKICRECYFDAGGLALASPELETSPGKLPRSTFDVGGLALESHPMQNKPPEAFQIILGLALKSPRT